MKAIGDLWYQCTNEKYTKLAYLWCIAHFWRWLSRHFCVQEKTIRMCCPSMDIRMRDLWRGWHFDRAAVDDVQTGKTVHASPYVDSSRSNGRPHKCHHQIRPSITQTRVKYAPTSERVAMTTWIFYVLHFDCAIRRRTEWERKRKRKMRKNMLVLVYFVLHN